MITFYLTPIGWNSLTMWKWSRIEMVQILSNFLFQASFWCWNLIKLADAALKGSFCLRCCLNCEDAANVSWFSPDAAMPSRHLSNICCGFVCLAVILFSNIVYQINSKSSRQRSKIWIGCQDVSENPSRFAKLPKIPVLGFTGVSDSIRESSDDLAKWCRWIDLDEIYICEMIWNIWKPHKGKVGNRIKVSDSDFSNLIYKFSNTTSSKWLQYVQYIFSW